MHLSPKSTIFLYHWQQADLRSDRTKLGDALLELGFRLLFAPFFVQRHCVLDLRKDEVAVQFGRLPVFLDRSAELAGDEVNLTAMVVAVRSKSVTSIIDDLLVCCNAHIRVVCIYSFSDLKVFERGIGLSCISESVYQSRKD